MAIPYFLPEQQGFRTGGTAQATAATFAGRDSVAAQQDAVGLGVQTISRELFKTASALNQMQAEQQRVQAHLMVVQEAAALDSWQQERLRTQGAIGMSEALAVRAQEGQSALLENTPKWLQDTAATSLASVHQTAMKSAFTKESSAHLSQWRATVEQFSVGVTQQVLRGELSPGRAMEQFNEFTTGSMFLPADKDAKDKTQQAMRKEFGFVLGQALISDARSSGQVQRIKQDLLASDSDFAGVEQQELAGLVRQAEARITTLQSHEEAIVVKAQVRQMQSLNMQAAAVSSAVRRGDVSPAEGEIALAKLVARATSADPERAQALEDRAGFVIQQAYAQDFKKAELGFEKAFDASLDAVRAGRSTWDAHNEVVLRLTAEMQGHPGYSESVAGKFARLTSGPEAEALGRAASFLNAGGLLDHTNPDVQKAGSDFDAQFTNATTADRLMRARETGVVTPRLEAELNVGLRSADSDLQARTLDQFNQLKAWHPVAVRAQLGADSYGLLEGTLARVLRGTPLQAALKAAEADAKDPDRGKAAGAFVSSKEGRAVMDNIMAQVGRSANPQIARQIEEQFKSNLTDAGGGIQRATEQTLNEMAKLYGPSEFAGEGRIMARPPERYTTMPPKDIAQELQAWATPLLTGGKHAISPDDIAQGRFTLTVADETRGGQPQYLVGFKSPSGPEVTVYGAGGRPATFFLPHESAKKREALERLRLIMQESDTPSVWRQQFIGPPAISVIPKFGSSFFGSAP